MTVRSKLARAHIWLGWIIGVPLLIWTATGLFMVAQPIDKVRGEHLKRAAPPLVLGGRVVAPAIGARAVKTMTLEGRPGGPVWVIAYADGGGRLADPATGELLPPIDARRAGMLARAAYAGPAALTSLSATDATNPPIELRRARPAWRAGFGDGTRIYIDAETGVVLATRTRLWRVFDFMWGLHIMDLRTREDTSHPVLIVAAALGLVGLVVGMVLLPMRRRRA